MRITSSLVAALSVPAFLAAADLKVVSEWGTPVATLTGVRNSYVSCQLVSSVDGPGAYSVEVEPFALPAEMYREWLHWLPKEKRHAADALVPVKSPYRSQMPEPDNRVADQRSQPFWLDIWIPKDAKPGRYETTAKLNGTVRARIAVEVLPAVAPDEDAVAIDHNSYGTSWFASQYPGLAQDRYFDLIHAYHRIFYEHRGVFHQLGYGHAGKVGPEFAPVLAGTGKSKHVVDWTAFDRHYGPLLDGSAFAGTRRGVRPIPFVYLPINPEWPASLMWWGEPGYEREFVNVVSEMERHFRERGWTNTRFELFFNHKKRYKGFDWDGDEARFPEDSAYMREYARLMRAAVPSDSPVKFVFRADASWTMERQFRDLAGVVNFWVCGGGMFSWYRGAPEMLHKRGDIVWTYGGTPPVTEPLVRMTLDPLRAWMQGVDGYVRWLTTSPGDNPWFGFEGGAETLVYPGERFGIAGPISSMRLKAERNAVQDINLLAAKKADRAEVARRFNGTTVDEWWTPRPKLADGDPLDWNNADIDDATPRSPRFEKLEPGAWERVHAYAMELSR